MEKRFLGIRKIILGVGDTGLDFSITIHVTQISLVELKVVRSAACSRVGPERRQFEDIAVYAGPKTLDVFKIKLISIHPQFTFYLPGQLRTNRRLCRAFYWAQIPHIHQTVTLYQQHSTAAHFI